MPAGWKYPYDVDNSPKRDGTKEEYAYWETTLNNSGFDGYPFAVIERDIHGDPLELWDQTTWLLNQYGTRQYQSKSASEMILVAGPGTGWPVGFTKEELAVLVRLRKFYVSGSAGYTIYSSAEGGGTEEHSTDFQFSAESGQYINCNYEEPDPWNNPDVFELVTSTTDAESSKQERGILTTNGQKGFFCSCTTGSDEMLSLSYNGISAQGDDHVFPMWDASVGILGGIALKVGDLIYPSMVIRVSTHRMLWGVQGFISSAIGGGVWDAGVFSSKSATLSMNGIQTKNIPLYEDLHYIIGSDQGTPTGYVSVNISADSFFPYKNSEGQPVFDTTSGGQINPIS